MQFRILRLYLEGIKNIGSEIELNFTKDKINGKTFLDEGKIKSIYGGNGSGKTAIILGVWIVKQIASQRNYLIDNLSKIDLINLINKKEKVFKGTIIFESLNTDSSLKSVYKYSLKISIVNGNIKISDEYLGKLRKNNNISSGAYETIFNVKDGKLVALNLSLNMNEKNVIIEKTQNILSFSSFLSEAEDMLSNNSINNNFKDDGIITCISFFKNLSFCFCKEDESRRYPSTKEMESLRAGKYFQNKQNFEFFSFSPEVDIVPKKSFEKYKEELDNLCAFLKIFKADILDMEAEKVENNNFFMCNKYICYKDYRIETSYESAGIKKLIHLFSALKSSIEGKIVFIDELDTNINSIYLNKFLLFFKKYGEGQLIFTSHNLEPMDVLETEFPLSTKSLKYSIDFINDEQLIVSWKKNGHYHAHNQYYDGAIKGSPFNIEPDEFVNCFFSKK